MELGYRAFNATLLLIPPAGEKVHGSIFYGCASRTRYRPFNALRGLGTAPSMLQVHVILHPRCPRESWENI